MNWNSCVHFRRAIRFFAFCTSRLKFRPMPGFRAPGRASWLGVPVRSAISVDGKENSPADTQIRVGPAALLHDLSQAVDSETVTRLDWRTRGMTLNLITIKRELELPTDFERLKAVWPGPIFEFKPDYKGEPSADIRSINDCLSLVAAGIWTCRGPVTSERVELDGAAYAQLMARPVAEWGGVVTSNKVPQLQGKQRVLDDLGYQSSSRRLGQKDRRPRR